MTLTCESQSVIRQSGVIAYRVRDGRVEIALVTSSSGRGWTVPKGHIEPDLDPQDSAAKEAFEEAGLVGETRRQSCGSYVYEKRGKVRQVWLYPMRVTDELRNWPEKGVRERRWVRCDQAASRVANADLGKCLERFESLVAA